MTPDEMKAREIGLMIHDYPDNWDKVILGTISLKKVVESIAQAFHSERQKQRIRDAEIADNFKYLSDCNCDRHSRIAQSILSQEDL